LYCFGLHLDDFFFGMLSVPAFDLMMHLSMPQLMKTTPKEFLRGNFSAYFVLGWFVIVTVITIISTETLYIFNSESTYLVYMHFFLLVIITCLLACSN